MRTMDAIQKMYNTAGVHPTTDPENPRSQFAVDRYEKHLRKLIKPGIRALDLGCNAGRMTFAMENIGAIATGIDCAEIPIRHAQKVAHKRGSLCQFNIGDIAALPYKANSFDFALLPQNHLYLSYQALENLTVQLKQILSENGLFVIIMRDESIRSAGEKGIIAHYDVQTGSIGGHITIPDKGVFAYPTYFWTVAFAKYIIEKYLFCKQVEEIEENRFLLVFCNR